MAKIRKNAAKQIITTESDSDINDLAQDAESGDIYAQVELATIYRDGSRLPKNDKKAFAWSLAAANQGDSGSMYEVGNSYALGIGVEQNVDEAVKWLSKLAYPETTEASRSAEMLNAQILMAAIFFWPGNQHNLAKAYGWLLLAICYGQPWNVKETPYNSQLYSLDSGCLRNLSKRELGLRRKSHLKKGRRARKWHLNYFVRLTKTTTNNLECNARNEPGRNRAFWFSVSRLFDWLLPALEPPPDVRPRLSRTARCGPEKISSQVAQTAAMNYAHPWAQKNAFKIGHKIGHKF